MAATERLTDLLTTYCIINFDRVNKKRFHQLTEDLKLQLEEACIKYRALSDKHLPYFYANSVPHGTLRLSNCRGITADGFKYLSEQKKLELQHIHLDGFHFEEAAIETAVLKFFTQQKQIHTLSLENANMKDSTFSKILANASPFLTHLNIAHLNLQSSLFSSGKKIWGVNCPNLISLNVSSWDLSDESPILDFIFSHAPKLRNLCMSRTSNLLENDLLKILKQSINLEQLDISESTLASEKVTLYSQLKFFRLLNLLLIFAQS
jgi:hypothetical protein